MYNGIGLQSVRGSGTNGYVQRNLSHVPAKRSRTEAKPWAPGAGPIAPRKPNEELLEHDRKRLVEVKLCELREELEQQTPSLSADEIESRLEKRRVALLAQSTNGREQGRRRPDDTHQQAAAKQAEDAQFRRALRIGEEHVVGSAFDRELQAHKKLERQAKREEEARALAEHQAAAERELQRAKREEERRRRKEEKAARKEERRRRRAERDETRRDRAELEDNSKDDSGDEPEDSRKQGKRARGDAHKDDDSHDD
eukprot:CAMPEP_0119414890 /NCGR_PEP_ID=MMETSP1335-20130426/7231_1 /TAXON_ID=259385 /ORGANISM="Chrysoculter rhomboideus, Strain RCC1486" /LENGTH=254 /DNA_ID=CAMNT_0007439785 /DNA_START=40 /DNA_END=804 /DNA_ORIENTATION=+